MLRYYISRLAIVLSLICCTYLGAATINFTDTNIVQFGWQGGTNAVPVGADAPFYLTYSGTGIAVQLLAGTLKCISDGTGYPLVTAGSVIDITAGAPATITTGLANTNHTLYCYGVAGVSAIQVTGAFVITGGTSVADTTFGPQYQVGTTPFSTYGKIDGCPYRVTTVQGYDNTTNTNVPNLSGISEISLRYYATGSTQSLFASYGFGGNIAKYALYQDGTLVGSWTFPNSSGTYINSQLQLGQVTGLDPGQHLYEWISYGMPGFAVLSSIMSSGALVSQAVTAKNCVVVYGDSIAAGPSTGTQDGRLAWWAGIHATGWSTSRVAQGGAKVVGQLELYTGDVTGATPQVGTTIIHQGGVNDQQAFVNAGSIVTFQASVLNELTQMASGLTAGAKMLWEGILPNTATNSAQRSNYVAAELAAVTAYNLTSPAIPACFYDTTGWIITGTDTAEGLHPIGQNASSVGFPFGNPLIGYGKISNRLSFILQGYSTGASVTFTGASSGRVGVSTNLTISPVTTGATFSGEAATISDAAGGTFSPSSPITLTAGSSSVVISYTPVSSGSKTITLGGMANCWTIPSALSYNALPNSGGLLTVKVGM